jgi:hypothetical protein
MVSAYLIVVGVVVAVLLLIAVLMVYTYFSHEDDKEEAILPKVVVVRSERICGWCHDIVSFPFSLVASSSFVLFFGRFEVEIVFRDVL